MNGGSKTYWPLLLLLLPQVLKANDTAVIYGSTPTTPTTVTSPAHASEASATRLQITPDPQTASTSVTAATPRVTPPAVIPKPTPTPSPATTASSGLPPYSGKKYTVKPGDNLYRIGKANGTTLEAIKALNHMKTDNIYVGQVLMLPQAGFSYRPPQPVPQALPAPAPLPPTGSTQVAQAPVSPAPAPTVPVTSTTRTEVPANAAATSTPTPKIAPAPVATTVAVRQPVITTTPVNPVSPNSVVRIPHKLTPSEAQARLLAEADSLSRLDLGYDENWVPPGETQAWDMDCSNTSRYLYKKATGIELPRTASDQYYNLKIQDRAWDVPLDGNDKPDIAYLQRNLRVGDLLFWENTYKPQRDPPITHVTIFLGTDEKGNWIMCGSQSSSYGKYGRTKGGPDIYVFDPLKTAGGYSSWFGFVHKTGHFVAFGRPLASNFFMASSTPAR